MKAYFITINGEAYEIEIDENGKKKKVEVKK